LASCLGGGDVDGYATPSSTYSRADTIDYSDLFSIICYEALLPISCDDPAEYEGGEPFKLDRDSTVEDICDFIVQYIRSDVLVRVHTRSSIPDHNMHIQGPLVRPAVGYCR